MSVNRIGVQTLSDIQTRMQNKLGDPDQDRWTLADHINPAINDQLVEMARDMRMQHAGHAITTTNMTYSQGATGAELPAEIGLDSIFRVEDVTNQDIPVDIPYVSNRGIKAYGGQSSRGRSSLAHTRFSLRLFVLSAPRSKSRLTRRSR